MISAAILLPLCAAASAIAVTLHASGNNTDATLGIRKAMSEGGVQRFNATGYGMPIALMATLAAAFGQSSIQLALATIMGGGLIGLIVTSATEDGRVLRPLVWIARCYVMLKTAQRLAARVVERARANRAQRGGLHSPMRHPVMGAALPELNPRPRNARSRTRRGGAQPGKSTGSAEESTEDSAQDDSAGPEIQLAAASRSPHIELNWEVTSVSADAQVPAELTPKTPKAASRRPRGQRQSGQQSRTLR